LTIHSFPTRRSSDLYAATCLPEANEIIAGTKGGELFRFNPDTKEKTGHGAAGGDYFDLLPFGKNSVLGACGNGFIYQDALNGNGDRKSTRLNSSHVA